MLAWEEQNQQSESDDDDAENYGKREQINSDDDDDDDDDNRNEENSEDEDDEQHKIQKAINAVKNIFNRKTTKAEVDRFMDEHSDVMRQPASTGETFLHRLIETVHRRDGENPLNSQHVKPLIRGICVKDALEKPCSDGGALKTCLTLAFEKDLKSDILEKLLSYAGDKALKLIDGSGMAPLHLAVQYAQCNDERVEIIRLLLRQDDTVLRRLKKSNPHQPVETFLDRKCTRKGQDVEYSVYGEHERSSKAYLAMESSKESQATPREPVLNQIHNRVQDLHPDKALPTLADYKGPKGPKGPKDQGAVSRGDGAQGLEEDGLRQRQELGKLDERELKRRQLREKEEKNRQERTAQEKNGQQERELKTDERQARYEAAESERSRTRQPIAQDAAENYLNPTSTTSLSGRDQVANTRLKRAPTKDLQANADEEGSKTSQNSAPKRRPNSEMLAKNSTKILKMLKLHYMRTRNIKMATSFLYGRNNINDIQIYFDYSGLPDQIDSHTFEERFGKDATSGIRFDEVLMYVRFPQVTVTRKGKNARQSRPKGRDDMEFFFGWLHRKGVRRILRVEVDDGGRTPHGDESIQNSLDKIIIEHLDWSKLDLDPRLICQISSNAETTDVDLEAEPLTETRNELREITLQWSGNNAVLRAWSEINGLPQLPKLQMVNLNIPTQTDLYDSESWVNSRIDEFQHLLNQNARQLDADRRATADSEVEKESESTKSLVQDKEKKIEVKVTMGKKGTEPFTTSGTGAIISTEKPTPFTEHEWITYMERFAGCMNSLWQETLEKFDESARRDQNDARPPNKDIRNLTSLKEDVVVALIDDGVDSCDSAFAGRIIEGKTFDYQEGSVGQHYISARGHGTEMARMILKACPMASIYSIRLKTHISPEKGQATIDVFSAASAIEAALDKKATIISMSWTIPVPADGSKEKQRLDSVLKRACSEKVLMFCSSSDQISTTQHYPSAYKRNQFLLIGAAHDDGSAYGHAGRDNDFIFPGVNVRTNDGSGLLPSYLATKTFMTTESTGSSIATALAAGFAAIIIYCFKASVLGIAITRIRSSSFIDEADIVRPMDLDKLSDPNVLKMAFSRIGEMENGSFIPIWEKFKDAIGELQPENEYKRSRRI
ncbi:hypothetical protein TrVFT333_002767 [Trichoderma virens FT-333]|nr:hypothetical protein TrVFT333_002767 [Trichoderma virens FT-333]